MAPHLVRFDDLLAGFDWVNAEPMQNSAYVSRRTGQVHWVSEVIELDDELPDDIEDTSVYVAIPSKNDLRLGKSLAQELIREHIPDEFGRVVAFFHHRGAYAKFKDLLDRRGPLDAWHQHEAGEAERSLRAWATQEDIYVEPPLRTSSD